MIVESAMGLLAALGFGLGEAACPSITKAKTAVETYLASDMETGIPNPDDSRGFRVSGSVDPDKARRIDSFQSAQVWKLAKEVRVYCAYAVGSDPAPAVTFSRSLFNPKVQHAVTQRVEKSHAWTGGIGMFGDPVWECRAKNAKLEFPKVCGR